MSLYARYWDCLTNAELDLWYAAIDEIRQKAAAGNGLLAPQGVSAEVMAKLRLKATPAYEGPKRLCEASKPMPRHCLV